MPPDAYNSGRSRVVVMPSPAIKRAEHAIEQLREQSSIAQEAVEVLDEIVIALRAVELRLNTLDARNKERG